MDVAFYWLGVGVAATVAVLAVAALLLFLYAKLLHGRFNLIFFRKGQRRLSIASWYNAKLMNDEHFHADDFVIGERPFYLSYEFSPDRRAFVMLGTIGSSRSMAIKGKHPEDEQS